jgi:hypothetical protein
MTTRTSDESETERERQAWRMPVPLLDFLAREAKSHQSDTTHFVTRLFQAFESYYDLPIATIAAIEVDRHALRMNRWNYYVHALDQRVRLIQDNGPGFDAATHGRATRAKAAAAPRVSVARWETGEKRIISWWLPAELRRFLRDEAAEMRWDLTPFATALLNAYAGFYPLLEERAALLERDRQANDLDRWEYFRHVWSHREERIAAEGPGFDAPAPRPGGRGR